MSGGYRVSKSRRDSGRRGLPTTGRRIPIDRPVIAARDFSAREDAGELGRRRITPDTTRVNGARLGVDDILAAHMLGSVGLKFERLDLVRCLVASLEIPEKPDSPSGNPWRDSSVALG